MPFLDAQADAGKPRPILLVLPIAQTEAPQTLRAEIVFRIPDDVVGDAETRIQFELDPKFLTLRSEERRVGKECRL